MMVAVLELESGLPIDNFTLAESTVGLRNVKVALRGFVGLLKAHREEPWKRYYVLLVLKT